MYLLIHARRIRVSKVGVAIELVQVQIIYASAPLVIGVNIANTTRAKCLVMVINARVDRLVDRIPMKTSGKSSSAALHFLCNFFADTDAIVAKDSLEGFVISQKYLQRNNNANCFAAIEEKHILIKRNNANANVTKICMKVITVAKLCHARRCHVETKACAKTNMEKRITSANAKTCITKPAIVQRPNIVEILSNLAIPPKILVLHRIVKTTGSVCLCPVIRKRKTLGLILRLNADANPDSKENSAKQKRHHVH